MITYIEFTCDVCGEEFHNGVEELEFGLMKSGELLCKTCRDERPRHEGVRNWTLPKQYVEETPEGDEEKSDEPDAIDRSAEERLDRRC